MRKSIHYLILSLLLFAVPNPAAAQNFSSDIEWEVTKELDLEAAPLDVAASVDGKYLFILLPGELLFYSFSNDDIIKKIQIEEGFDMISSMGAGSHLILSSTSGKKIKFIRLQDVYLFSFENVPYIGPHDAPITIVIFNDYQCPYCQNLTVLLEQVREKYPQDVKVIYKHFPLAMHKSARLAGTAVLAAERQGTYWEMHAKLHENQHLLNEEKVNELARELGLDMEKFQNDMKDPAFQELIARDIQEGQFAGVRGTPTIFVNGIRLGSRNLQGFSTLIDAELAKESFHEE